MVKHKYFYRLLVAIYLVFAQQVVAMEIQQALVIHSSYEGYPWTDSIQRGINEEFSQSDKNLNVWVEYIDVKRNTDPNYFAHLQSLFSLKYKSKQIDVVIVADNEAYNFLMEIRETLFPNTPIVFTGFNGYQPDTLNGKHLVTGIVEENSFKETIDIALTLHPTTKKIVFVIPNSLPQRLLWIKEVSNYYEQFDIVKITSNDLTTIDNQLSALGKNIIVIPLNSLRLKTGSYLSFEAFVKHLATKGNYPIYGLWDIALGHGISGGKLVSGRLQGKASAQLALKILNGTPTATLPVVTDSPNKFMFDWLQLQRFNISTDDLPDGAIIINKAPSFYEKYKLLVWLVSLIIVILLLLISTLIANIIYRQRSEEKLKLAASVFTNARESIFITDFNGVIIDVNDTFTRITGFSRKEAIGNKPRILRSYRQDAHFYDDMWKNLTEHGNWSGEIWNRRKNGEEYAEMKTISAVRNAQGVTTHFVALGNDITTIKQHQQQLERIAHYDLLTNLPNRVLLADRISQSMLHCNRQTQSLAVVFLDLDGFKAVNDTYGHDIGDKLLITLSRRMKTVLRQGDSLARIGGDEFVAVLTGLNNITDYERILERLLLSVSETITIDDIVVNISASIGVTLYPRDNVDADLLMRHADQAMYSAKESGKNCYYIFDTAQDDAVKMRREHIEEIRVAIDNQQFVLHYQPKVNMKTGQVTGFEALIRWQHPEQGLLSPIEFLPFIEHNPMMIELGEWVIDSALQQISEWKKTDESLPINVSVNIAAVQLQQPNFTQRLTTLLAAHNDVKPQHLELEVLETSALDNVHDISIIMKECMKLGVIFALDDFGTGYSSLTYLRRLPAKLIKIDQTFVRDMLTDPDDLAIIQGVIALAKSFNREVIAEGVETVEHGTALLQLGCELAQGYGIAKPMPASEVLIWTRHWHPDASWR